MASLREIRQKIKSYKSTPQTTKAMKMVAAARLKGLWGRSCLLALSRLVSGDFFKRQQSNCVPYVPIISLGLLSAIILLTVSNLNADDLNWCDTSRYIAYDYSGYSRGEKTKHEIRVIRFAQKPLSTLKVSIPDGRVIRLYCEPDELKLVQKEHGPAPHFEPLGTFSQYIDISASEPKASQPVEIGKNVKLPGNFPRSFEHEDTPNGMARQDMMAKEIKLSSGYRLIFDRTEPTEPCSDVHLKVSLRAHGALSESDYKFLETSWPKENCGE